MDDPAGLWDRMTGTIDWGEEEKGIESLVSLLQVYIYEHRMTTACNASRFVSHLISTSRIKACDHELDVLTQQVVATHPIWVPQRNEHWIGQHLLVVPKEAQQILSTKMYCSFNFSQ